MAKRHHEEHVNHEAWAIPYGDLITLLLAFFVVMYALSSVNEGKYRILSDSLVAAFRSSPRSLEPVQVGSMSRSTQSTPIETPRTLVPLEIESFYANQNDADSGIMSEEAEEEIEDLEELSAAISEELADLLSQDLVRLRQTSTWLAIEMNTSVLFPVASADLAQESQPIIRRIGEILSTTNTRLQVEGHTDVVPINTPAYPSNWELSAARAATVVRTFTTAGVEPARMAAVGFGEYQPAADNDTPEGRSRNRRVTVVVTNSRRVQREQDRGIEVTE